MRRVIIPLAFLLFVGVGQAGVSLITSAIIFGGEKVYDYGLESTLDGMLRELSSSAGEVCVLTEHFIIDNGISYSTLSLLQSGLETNSWNVNEVSKESFTNVIWLLSRQRFGANEQALLTSMEVNGVGLISICKW